MLTIFLFCKLFKKRKQEGKKPSYFAYFFVFIG